MASPNRKAPAPLIRRNEELAALHPNPFLRIKGRDKGAFAILGQDLRRQLGSTVIDRRTTDPGDDYTQIDLSLTLAEVVARAAAPPSPAWAMRA